jgi:alkanesulfonate monooxygenase SsuD/methylene tetrahydromethanopterin reductase-like flavin-dependent oxidoreductase (luciferase family)
MPPGYTTEATLRSKVTSQIAQAARRADQQKRAFAQPSFEEIVEKGYVIVGSPDEVAEQLREVATELNVGQLMLLLQFGNMRRDLAAHNTELFAKRVMPQLHALFDDGFEDRWWPQPLPREERAAVRGTPR